MAKSKSGLLGPFYGKIGPVIGSHWKSTNYIKSVSAKQPKQHEVYSSWYNDSTALTEQVLIYPDGAIKFGTEGFVGNAKAVLLLRQQNQQRDAKANYTLTVEKMDSQKVNAQANMEQSAERTISKRINFASLRWGIVVVFVMVAVAYWYWRKR